MSCAFLDPRYSPYFSQFCGVPDIAAVKNNLISLIITRCGSKIKTHYQTQNKQIRNALYQSWDSKWPSGEKIYVTYREASKLFHLTGETLGSICTGFVSTLDSLSFLTATD